MSYFDGLTWEDVADVLPERKGNMPDGSDDKLLSALAEWLEARGSSVAKDKCSI